MRHAHLTAIPCAASGSSADSVASCVIPCTGSCAISVLHTVTSCAGCSALPVPALPIPVRQGSRLSDRVLPAHEIVQIKLAPSASERDICSGTFLSDTYHCKRKHESCRCGKSRLPRKESLHDGLKGANVALLQPLFLTFSFLTESRRRLTEDNICLYITALAEWA